MGQSDENNQFNPDQDQDDVEAKQINKDKKGLTKYFITIEPIKYLIGFTVSFTSGVTIDLIQRNVCAIHYNLTYTDCLSLNASSDIHKETIEAKTAQINMINNVVQGIFALSLSLFIGPWSDTNGRKPFILWSTRGYMLYYFLWTVMSFYPNIPFVLLILPSIPLGCSGSQMAMFVCTWSYTCDNFSSEERAKRFSVSVAAMVFGNLTGNALADVIFRLGGNYGFQLVFSVSFLAALTAYLYTHFVLEETVVCKKKGKLLDLKNIMSIIEVLILKPRKGKLITSFVLIVLFTEIPTYIGEESIVYMIGKSQYNWTLGDYNLFAALSSMVPALCPVIGIWFLTDVCGYSNVFVLIVGGIFFVVFQPLKAFSVNEEMYWAMSLLCKISSLMGPTIDSELVDTVSEDNVGKAFSFNSMIDSVAPLVAVPIYTQLYTALLPDKTLYLHFFSFGMGCIALTSSICLYRKKKSISYTPTTNEPEKEDEPYPETEALQNQC